jgi:hypothetical protein
MFSCSCSDVVSHWVVHPSQDALKKSDLQALVQERVIGQYTPLAAGGTDQPIDGAALHAGRSAHVVQEHGFFVVREKPEFQVKNTVVTGSTA